MMGTGVVTITAASVVEEASRMLSVTFRISEPVKFKAGGSGRTRF
jgi:hypothetical protein